MSRFTKKTIDIMLIYTEEKIWQFVQPHPELITKEDLKKTNNSMYNRARKYGMLDELFNERTATYNAEKETGKKDSYRKRISLFLEENPSVDTKTKFASTNRNLYNYARKLGILDEFFPESSITEKTTDTLNRLYTKEYIAQYIKEHPHIKLRTHLLKDNYRMWSVAMENGWMDELLPYKADDVYMEHDTYYIYAYEDEANKCAYVGLTSNPHQRDYQHIYNTGKHKGDTLYAYCKTNDIPVPEMKILSEHTIIQAAADAEKETWETYKARGWSMINSEKMLGICGSPVKKWTRRKVQDFISNHPELKTRQDLKKLNGTVYDRARKYGLLDDAFGEPHPKKWTEDMIWDWLGEHEDDIVTRKQFRRANPVAYRIFNERHPKIMVDMFGPDDRNITEDDVWNFIDEHPEIETKMQLLNHPDEGSVWYSRAKKLGMLDEIFQTEMKWSEDNIRKFIRDNRFSSRSQIQKENSWAYYKALKLGILDEFFPKTK